MGNFYAKKNMGSRGTEYRPEQVRALRILRNIFGPDKVETEKLITGLTIDGEPTSDAKLDIAIISGSNKLAIRLNGGHHFDSTRQRRKDEWQKIALEEAGWRVVDFNEDEMPNLWSDKKDESLNSLRIEEVMNSIR